MILVKKLLDLLKILLITFVFSLVIDFFLGSKILKYFDAYFAKSQFYERLIRMDHPIYHHTLRENVKYTNNVSFVDTYVLCTNNHGFKSKCDQVDNKNYEFAFIGDSFTEGTPIEYEDSFVGIFTEKTGYKTANLGIVSYSPKIYLSKLNYLIKQGFKFDHVVVFIDISDFYDDINFYSIDESLKVTEKNYKKKNLKRRKFLRNNFPLTNFYMFVLKKYKFKVEEDKELSVNENPVFTDKVNLKAKWTYSNENKIEGYDLGINEGNQIMVDQKEKWILIQSVMLIEKVRIQ